MAAYAALTSLMKILDQLEQHPFPPISLDKQQVESLTEIVTFLQEFLEGYDSPFVDSHEADPLEMQIADAAYAAEDVIESYIVDNIHSAAAATHHDEVINSCRDELNSEQEINYNEGTASLDDEVNISSGEETNNQKPKNDDNVTMMKSTHDDEVNSYSGDQVKSEEKINSNEETANLDNEVISSGSSGEETHNQKKKICRFFNCFRGSKKPKNDGKKNKNEVVKNLSMSTSDYSKEIGCVSLYEDVRKVIEEMDLVKKEVMEMMSEKPAVQAHHQLHRNILRSSSFSGKNGSVMVGFDDVLLQLLDKLTGGPSALQVIPITGMGGIGKTTLARNIFQHANVKEYFDICAWVTISQQYNTKEILRQILYQASGKSSEKSEEELHKCLFKRRYLIIMDDMWSIEVWVEMRLCFPNCENGSRVVVTTRQSNLISHFTDSNYSLHMKFLDEVNSWNLFSQTVVGEETFPLQLEKIGKKIVKNCNGLPLSIVVIGGLLAKSQHTHEHWEQIEQKLNSIVNLENDEYCLKILKLSYNHLSASLKPCFLYMGTFEEDTRIHVSTLVNLWVSEGFLKPENGKSLETIGEGFLNDLIDRNLILVDGLGSTGNIKYCKIHDLLRDLCLKEAEKERFYHLIGQHSLQGIHKHNPRRMVYPRINPIGVDVLKPMMSRVRSFISKSKCDSVRPLMPNIRLLRILNADRVEFPGYCLEDVICEFVNSRYVSIKANQWENSNLASVSFLWNLHTLRIVCGYTSPKFIFTPVEMWKMSQLKHVEFIEGYLYLPDPPSGSSVMLENLETLKGVVNFKFREDVVKRIPNIKKLLIYYDQLIRVGIPDDDDYCFSNLECLRKLESLTMTFNLYNDNYYLYNITFPRSLRKLCFESTYGSVIEWEEMVEKIGGSLPLLQKLKLEWGMFKTGKWETVEGQFPRLKFLELSYCRGLKQWMIEESSHFPCLEHLHLSGLKQLEDIPSEIGEIPTLQSIELSSCSESAVKSAKKIVEEQEDKQGELSFLVRVWHPREMQEALQSLASPNFQFTWTW